ncbi:hypothetical protein ACQ4PT_029584 [Festuca glaucescens]
MEGQGEPPNKRAALPLVAAPDAAPTVPGGGSDYFSRLPDHLLLRILLRLSTEEAAQTSALSQRWRGVWAQLPRLEFYLVESSVPARALAVDGDHGELDIHRVTVYSNQMDSQRTTDWLSLAAPRLSGVLYFDNSHAMSRETLQLFLHDVEEAVMRRGAFELPCFKKATVIRMDLGFLGLALPPAGVFHALRVMRLEHFWFRGQLSLSDTMLPSLRDLFIRRVRGLTILTLSSKSLLDIHLCLLPELRRLNILAPRLEELEVTGCFYVPESVASIAAERLEILKWEVPCVPELGEMPHLRALRVPPITTDWSEDFCADLNCFPAANHLALAIILGVQEFYSPDCICHKARPFFNNSHTVSRETLQLFLHDVEEAVMRRGAFELPCFNKATVIRMDLGFLGLALPPAGVFDALRVMRLQNFWFRDQLSISDTMLPSLRDLFICRVRGLTVLTLNSKSLLDIHLSLLPELRQLNILAPRLEELEVTGCFYVPEPVATIAAERLEILKWEVPCVPELGEMPHLRMEGQGEAPNQRAALPLVAAPTIPGGGSDHFSRLPDHLLVRILLRIPTKKAVEMSALSRRWRGVWTQLPILKFDGVESSVPAHALAVYRAHGELDIHSFTVYTNQMDAQDAAAWLSLLAPLLTGRLYFDNTDAVSPETLQLLLHEEEAVVPRDAFELPCFKKATEIWMDLGLLGLGMPPAAVFDVLRVMWLEHFWFRGQFCLSDTMLPSLQKLTIRRVRGLVGLMLNSKSLLYIHLSLLVEIPQINILAPRLEELDVTSCFYDVPEPVASIAAERLQILRWEVPCVPKPVCLRKIPHLLVLGAPPISTLWPENICADFLDCFPVVDRLELQISLGVQISFRGSIVGSGYATSGFDF